MKRIRGETTLDQMQRAYMSTVYRTQALRIGEALDKAELTCPGKQKQEALMLARYYINRAR